MRTFFGAIFLLVISLTGFSNRWVEISSTTPTPAQIKLLSSTIDRSVVHFTLGGFSLQEVETPRGQAYTVQVGKGTSLLEAGAPDLPKLTTSVVIPDRAGMTLKILNAQYKEFTDLTIAPSKGVILRDTDPSQVPYTFGPAYLTNTFYPGSLTDTREPFLIRNTRGQTLIALPFQYNPVTKVLRVYYDITIELSKSTETGINPLPAEISRKTMPQDFLSVYKHQFLNFDAVTYSPLEEYGNLLVICYGSFMDTMQPYVDWKRAEGYHTEMVNVSTVGTTATQIKSYIANYYNTKGLTHVLLVGDAQQIPTNTGGGLGGPSDNAYGYIVGNDHYADVFIGRFSAQTEAQVQTQVQRTLDYEKNPQNLTDDWFTTVIGIASDQGPGHNNEYDYQHIRNQQTELLDYTYTANPELFDGTQGGNDAPGNPTPAMVSTEVNNGASLILYTGHGSNTSWGTSGFSNTNVNQLTNMGKLPFIWSVACVNGNFVSTTCFAEAWLRASQGGQPTGAIAFLGSTINQSWDSPMEGQDAMTDILRESDSTNIKRTFAGLSINGCMKMIDEYGNDGENMADTWTVFGDPTIMVRTAVPQLMSVMHDSVLLVGDSILRIISTTQGARVTLSMADTLLTTGLITNDTLVLSFSPLTNAPDTIHLVVTAYNKLPYLATIPIRYLIPVSAGFKADTTRVIPGIEVSFSDTSSGDVRSRSWIFPGGTPETSSEKNPVILYSNRGIYDVTLIVGNSTGTDTLMKAEYITVDFPASTESLNPVFSTTVSPNPNHGNFLLKLATSGDESVDIVMFDILGNKTYQQTKVMVNRQRSLPIQLPGSANGLYFLQVKSRSGIITTKVIVR
ncbi:MAG: C25 family cysteine peptidase [Bacteroidales bacterium]|nr:C25 family cysteine peptidase [Bacteroidales bacterium]